METVINNHRVRVKKWCASCEHRDVDEEGFRVCRKMQLKVQQKFICSCWQLSSGLQNAGKFICNLWDLSDGLKNAGHQTGAVVRHFATKEIIID